MRLGVGQLVDGRYEVERILGAGGTAVVYLVRDRDTDTRHALKHLTISSTQIKDRMILEGKVQGEIEHPNVVRIAKVLMIDEAPGLLMEYVDGPSLEQALGRYRLTMGDAETLFQGVLAGVSAAHAGGLVHRDLKPANILLARTRDGFVPKVIDFGLAKLTDQDGAPVMGQTRSGIAMGTPSYMAPEQIRDARMVDRRADVWSLGCMLYELVSRQRTFPGDEALAIYNAIVEGEFIPVRKLVPDVPARIEQAIHGCLRIETAERIPDCDTLLAVLLGVREWAMPENTLTELSRETPVVPREAGPPRVSRASVVEFHPGGGGAEATGMTAANAPTALSPMSPISVTAGMRGASGPGPAMSAGPVMSAGPGLHVDTDVHMTDFDEEAATVITRAPMIDGTLAPHPSPVPAAMVPSSDRAGWFVGGGLVAAALVTLGTFLAIALVLLVVWVFVPAPVPTPSPAPLRVAPAPEPAAVIGPLPGAPEPTPEPTPPPAPPRPTPAAPGPAPSKAKAPTPSPAPSPSPAPVTPKPEPRPPTSGDPTRQRPDTGVPDKVSVIIGTVPNGAAVHIGNLSGSGPYRVDLAPSRHPVIVSAPGYAQFSKLIAVSIGGTNTWCFDLVKQEMTPTACP